MREHTTFPSLIPGKPSSVFKVSAITGCIVKLSTRFTARATSFTTTLFGGLNNRGIPISSLLGQACLVFYHKLALMSELTPRIRVEPARFAKSASLW